MHNKTVIFLVCTFMTINSLSAQDRKENRAHQRFDNFQYLDAIVSYEQLLAKGYSSKNIYQRLGNASYLNADYRTAATWYTKLVELKSDTIAPEYLYKYAQSLKSSGRYELSDQWMQKFEVAQKMDGRATKFASNTDYLNKIKENSGRYQIKNLAINSGASDFAPSRTKNQLVFATARDTGLLARNSHDWNKSPFLNFFIASEQTDTSYSDPRPFSKNLNTRTHESSIVFSEDGNTAYFTRNNSKNRNFARDSNGVSRLKIYSAQLENGSWENIEELPFNNDEYSNAHPSLSPDGSRLFFASDMPGSIGQSDIFMIEINSEGVFGEPKNLGNKINTEGRETFPFVTASNILYFASDGHPGLGGLDVYAVQLDDLDDANVINVGAPVNSEEDDFSYIIDEKSKKGFFASNRPGGKGNDDIYAFTEQKELKFNCSLLLKGIVKDSGTGNILQGAKVFIVDEENQLMAEAITDQDGSFAFNELCKSENYTLVAQQQAYTDGKRFLNISRILGNVDVEVELDPIVKQAQVGDDLGAFLGIEPIYFDLDKSFIRKDAELTLSKVISYLHKFPDVKIQVQSHTDVRASQSYNKSLSDRRAKATKEYLIANGIAEKRVSSMGFGESRLVNGCNSKGACSDSEHQLNRRSEFIIID